MASNDFFGDLIPKEEPVPGDLFADVVADSRAKAAAAATAEAARKRALVENQGLGSMLQDGFVRFGQASRDLLTQGIDLLQPDAAPTDNPNNPMGRIPFRIAETLVGAARGGGNVVRAIGEELGVDDEFKFGTGFDALGNLIVSGADAVGAPLEEQRRLENARRAAAGRPSLEQETAMQGTTQFNNMLRTLTEVGSNELKSEAGKAAEAELALAQKGGIGTMFEQITGNPLQSANIVIPQMIPMLATALGVGAVTRLPQAAVAAGAGMEATSASDQAERKIMRAPEAELPAEYHQRVQAGEDALQVRMELARRAGDTARGTTGALTGLTGLSGLAATRKLGLDQIEDIVANAGVTGARGRAAAALGTAGAEMPTEFADEVAAALGANAAEVDIGTRELGALFDPEVAAQGLLGMAAGGVTGGLTGALATPTPRAPPPKVEQADAEPNADPLPADPVQPRAAQAAPVPPSAPEADATPEADEAAANDIMDALVAAGLVPPPVPEQGGNPEPVAPAAGSQPAAAVPDLAEQFTQSAPSSSAASVERPQQVQAVTGQAAPAAEPPPIPAAPRRAFEDSAAVARRSTVQAYLDEGLDPDLAERLADNPFLPKGAIRDDVTGYFDGKVSGAKIGTVKRAQEFVRDTGEDAVYVSGDIFNLGGLNSLFKNNMEAANGHFRAMTDFALDALRDTGADVVPMRTGGDEVGFVVVNASQEVVNRALETADARIREYARANGFDRVPHAKKGREGEFGIGLHFGTASIEPGDDVGKIMADADAGVDASKNRGKANESGSAARPAGLDGQDPGADRSDAVRSPRGESGNLGSVGRGEGAPVPERAAAAPARADEPAGPAQGEVTAPESAPLSEERKQDILRLRGEIGWSQRGGGIIRGGPVSDNLEDGADFGRATGEVIGRATWEPLPRLDGGGESTMWRNRPAGVTAKIANEALNRLESGRKLSPKMQEFVDYLNRVQDSYDAERAEANAEFAREQEAERSRRPAGDLFAAPTAREQVRAAQEQRDARRDGRTGSGRTDMLAGDGELFAGPRPEQARVDESPRPTSDAEWLSLAEAASPPVRGVDDLRQFLQVRRHPEIEAAFEGLGGGSVDAVASNVARRIWDSSIPFRNLDTPGQPASETATPFGEASASTRFQPLAELPATRGDGTPRRGLVQMQKALAQRLGRGLTPQDNAALVAFMDRFADHLGDIGLSFRRGNGPQGQFIPAVGVVEIFSQAIKEGSVKRTTIHEFWHALARHLTDAQVEAVRSAYRRGKAAWRKANPELSGFMDQRDWTLRGPAAEAWMRDTKGARGHESAERVIVQRDDAGRVQSVRLARTDETYRYTNVDEFFAEEMADRTESSYESAEARGVLNAARKIMADLWYMLRRIVGRAEVDRLFRDYMGGRVAPNVQRRSVAESAGNSLAARESARGERSIEHEGETFVRRGRDYLLADETGEPRDFTSADAAEAEAERLGGEVLQDEPGDGPRTWSVRLPEGVARSAESALLQRKDVPQAQAEAARKRATVDSALGNPINGGALGWNPKAAKWEGSREARRKARVVAQDAFIALRDTQQDIEAATGRPLEDLQNVYQLENLMHGRTQAGVEALDDQHFDPLFDAMRNAGVTVKQLEDYLEARHAPERNREIAAINPRMPDGGSGMTTADARTALAGMDRAKLEPLARRVDAIVKETRKRMLDAGVITREAYDAMTAQYQYYVPLRGVDESKSMQEQARAGFGGGGLDIRTSGLKGALGRGAGNRATDILGEVIGDAQRAVIAAEKARVGRGLARLVLANPNPSFWQMEAVRTEQAKDSQGQVYQRLMNESLQPDVVHVMVKGVPYRIQFKDPNLAAALRNIGGTGKFLTLPVFRQIATSQRYIAATLTAWNPGFVLTNIARDLQFGLARIAAEHGLPNAGLTLARYPLAIRAMWRLERKKGARPGNTMDAYAREFEGAGGKTGWMHVASVDALSSAAMWRSSGSPLASGRRAGAAILKAIEDLNDTFENTMRLSYYAGLRDAGLTPQQAAQKAKDLTVNFNRKGTAGPALSAGYLFFNAAAQGTHALGRAVDPTKPHGRKILAGLGGVATLQFFLAAMASGMEDEDGEDYASKVPEWIKERNLWWVGSDGQVYTIPMAFGFNIATYAGSRFHKLFSSDAENVASGAKSAGSVAGAMIGDLTRVAVSAVLPVQVAQSGVAAFIPTEIGQHIVQQTANKDDFGRQIWTENTFDRITPRAVLGRDATPEGYKVIATALNRLGGGDDYTKPIALLDIAPEQIQFSMSLLTGGTGNWFGGAAQTAFNAAFDPEANEQRPTPLLQTFTRPLNDVQVTAAKFYERREAIEIAADRIRDMAERDGIDAAREYADSLPFMAGVAIKLTKGGEAQIRPGNSAVYSAFKDAEKAGEVFRDDRRQAYATDSSMFSAERSKALREASQRHMKAQKELLREWNAATESIID